MEEDGLFQLDALSCAGEETANGAGPSFDSQRALLQLPQVLVLQDRQNEVLVLVQVALDQLRRHLRPAGRRRRRACIEWDARVFYDLGAAAS